ncbi:MAG TPA: peptidyl-prolyl cis-trans isomerase [Planctomycetota bacterium]|nr:peptidyl-prolyl cis-trans isomerase [Planctomycetota bacterium]
MKRPFWIVGVLFCLVAASVRSLRAEGPAGIVSIVGEDVITRSELDRELHVHMGQNPDIAAGVRFDRPAVEKALLRQMQDELLILQEIARNYAAADVAREEKDPSRRSSEVDLDRLRSQSGESSYARQLARYVPDSILDQEIERRIEDLRQAGYTVASRQEFYRFIEATHQMSSSDFRAFLRGKIAIAKYKYERMFRSVDTWVTPQEMRYYYSARLDEFTVPVKIFFRRIVLARDQEFKARKVREGLAAGQSFFELAKQYSDEDPSARGNVLSLSYEELLLYKEPMPTLLRTLEKGGVSDPVILGRTICFFQLEEREQGEPKPFEEVQDQIREKILNERRTLSYQKEMERLRAATVIKDFLPAIAAAKTGTTATGVAEHPTAVEGSSAADGAKGADASERVDDARGENATGGDSERQAASSDAISP